MKIENFLKIENWKLIILAFFAISFLFSAKNASAAIVIQAPKYIGLNSGLVGYWSFNSSDMAGNTAFDRSGQGNNGTLTNGPTRAIGKIGQALDFDGGDDVVVANVYTSFTSYTWSMWVRSDTVPSATDNRPFSNSDGDNGFLFNWGHGDVNFRQAAQQQLSDNSWVAAKFTSSLSVNTWYFIVATWDGSNLRAYLNGNLEATTAAASLSTPSGILGIGAGDAIGGAPFDGLIDDVRIYNRALSPDEIKRLYKIGATFKINVNTSRDNPDLENGLVGYWSFDGADIAGVTAFDRSGQGNNGTLTNGPTRAVGKLGQGLSFDGVDDYGIVISPTNLDLPGAMTACTWIKPHSIPNSSEAVIFNNFTNPSIGQYSFEIDYYDGSSVYPVLYWSPNGASFYYIGAGDAGGLISYNQWSHICVVRNSSSAGTVYTNGIARTTNINGGSIPTSGFGANNGIGASEWGQFFDGLIDDLRIYNRALSADEIKRLYKIGATFKINVNTSRDNPDLENGLVGYWSFDGPDMAGNTAYDKAPATLTAGSETIENYTTAGTTQWVAPAGVTSVQVELWGGGGAGGGLTVNNTIARGGGGAGGQYSIKTVTVVPGNTYPLIVAATRSGGTGNGNDGNDSTFNTTTVVAKGGAGGKSYENGGAAGTGSTSGGVGDTVNAGGNGSNGGGVSTGGAGGGGAGSTGIGGSASGNTAGTGTSQNGGNGGAGRTSNGNGNAGTQAGGGGGAGANTGTTSSTDRSGGTGAAGRARLTYTPYTSNTNNGTLTNGPTRAIGKIGQGLSFDGSDDYVNTNYSANLSTITISGWIKINAWVDANTIVSKQNDGIHFFADGAILVFVRHWSGPGDVVWKMLPANSILPGQWYHVAVTYDDSSTSNAPIMYINGVSQTVVLITDPPSGSPLTGTDNYTIGARPNPSTLPLNGIIDDVRIYNRALSADEIKRLYNLGR